jgi:hypothetical protein
MSKTVEEMTSTELKAHLAGTTPEPVKATKTKAPAKSKAKSKAKASKPTKAKAPAKTKAKARKPAKSNKPKRVPAVRLIAAFMVENKGKAFKSTDLAAKFKARPVEIHRAVSLLERQGAVVDAARSGPTQKPGRRAFLYTVTKAPVVKASKSKAGK